MTGLVLAGTYEARLLCAELAQAHVDAVASLAGVTRKPEELAIKTRIGGFGGEDGFQTYVVENKIKWVIDATHPFATKMTAMAAKVCDAMGLPYMILQRPEWVAGPSDDWHPIGSVDELPSMVPEDATVFLGTGRQTLADFSVLSGRRLLCRVVDQPSAPFPFEGGQFLVGRPPFSVEEEVQILTQNKIDWLVVKNSGGAGGYAKLAAAAKLGLPVAMFNRAALPDATLTQDVSQAMAWMQGIML